MGRVSALQAENAGSTPARSTHFLRRLLPSHRALLTGDHSAHIMSPNLMTFTGVRHREGEPIPTFDRAAAPSP